MDKNFKNKDDRKTWCLREAFRIRVVEEKIASEYPKGKMRCPTHLSIGQEINASMVSSFLSDHDLAISTHRPHAHYLAKGGNLKGLIAELYGLPSGCSGGYGGSMHLRDLAKGFVGSVAIVGGSIPIGVGLGIGLNIQRKDGLSVLFLGEAATEQGVFYESLNIAALRQSPTVFVCEDNLYSVYTPPKSRVSPNRSLMGIVKSLDVKYFECTERDMDLNIDIIEFAINEARSTRSPVFIFIPSYRYLEHCGPNDDSGLGYRSVEEVVRYRSLDLLTSAMAEVFDKISIADMRCEFESEISQVFEECEIEYASLNGYQPGMS